MKRILVTIANHVYNFEIEVESNASPDVVFDYLTTLEETGWNSINICTLIYDVTAHVVVKSSYSNSDLTKEAIGLLLDISKEISPQNLLWCNI